MSYSYVLSCQEPIDKPSGNEMYRVDISHGFSDDGQRIPFQSLFGGNIQSLVEKILKEADISPNPEDDIVRTIPGSWVNRGTLSRPVRDSELTKFYYMLRERTKPKI